MTNTLPDTLIDMSPWGASILATPDTAAAMAAELSWDLADLDRLHLNDDGTAYLLHQTVDGRTQTQIVRVRPGSAPGEFVAVDD
jgi:hypothetical protein